MSSLSDFFSQRIVGRQYLRMFENQARTITNEYIEDAYLFVKKHGYSPSFSYIMEKMQALTNELTLRAQWMRDEYKEGRGGKASIKLTTSCKRVMKGCIAEYLNVTKTLNNINVMTHGAPFITNSYFE